MTRDVVVTPLTGSIGARVTGVDVRREIPGVIAEQIRDAFARYFVLVFSNDAEVGSEEQTRLAALFGEPQPLAIFQFLGTPNAAIKFAPGSRIAPSDDDGSPLTRDQVPQRRRATSGPTQLRDTGFGADSDGWHTDSSFTPWLPRVAVLRAEVISPIGGDTGFSSLCAAYDGLSPVMQGWLEHVEAVHIVPPGYKDAINLEQYGHDAEDRFDAEYPPRRWPVVIQHPENRRKALFVNAAYTASIEGMSPAESTAVLRFLFTHVRSTDYVYRHHWAPGDLVLWDELTCLHRAPMDFAPHDRRVVRVTAGRVVPTAPRGSRIRTRG